MPDLAELRRHAIAIFNYSLQSVDARVAVESAVQLSESALRVCGEEFPSTHRTFDAISIGKAGGQMALGLQNALGNRIKSGVLSCPLASSAKINPLHWKIFSGGHPLPNEDSLKAAQAAFNLLQHVDGNSIVFFLISGGGSAMMEWPVSDRITLEDLRETNRLLISCGAAISEVNLVRRAISSVKGGKLARHAHQGKLITLIISDTSEGDEASVASGPTIASPTTAVDAMKIIRDYELDSTLPESVIASLQLQPLRSVETNDNYHVLLNNSSALKAAAERASALGYETLIDYGISDQTVSDGCQLSVERLQSLKRGSCLISGGEFSCPVRGPGVGGRNSETALRLALLLERESDGAHTVFLSAGTDGIDGNSVAAGAIVDDETTARAATLGLAPLDYLSRSDSFNFFDKLGDPLITGPTGTNVRDVRILLKA